MGLSADTDVETQCIVDTDVCVCVCVCVCILFIVSVCVRTVHGLMLRNDAMLNASPAREPRKG